jgi:hypothetical protein
MPTAAKIDQKSIYPCLMHMIMIYTIIHHNDSRSCTKLYLNNGEASLDKEILLQSMVITEGRSICFDASLEFLKRNQISIGIKYKVSCVT